MGQLFENRKVVNTEELAAVLKISASTIRKWVHRKQIPFMRAGGVIRFDVLEILAWLKRHEEEEKDAERQESVASSVDTGRKKEVEVLCKRKGGKKVREVYLGRLSS